MNGREMDVGDRRVDVIVTHQCLENSEIHAGFGQRGTEGVAECMWMASSHTGASAMVAEDGTQSGRRQRFATVWTFGHDEHLTRISFRSFRKQIALNQTGDLRIQRNPSLLVALTNNTCPSERNIHVTDLQAQDFGGTQSTQQHQPGDRPIAQRAEAFQQGLCFAWLQATGQAAWFPQTQTRPRPGLGEMAEQSRALASGGTSSLTSARDGVG